MWIDECYTQQFNSDTIFLFCISSCASLMDYIVRVRQQIFYSWRILVLICCKAFPSRSIKFNKKCWKNVLIEIIIPVCLHGWGVELNNPISIVLYKAWIISSKVWQNQWPFQTKASPFFVKFVGKKKASVEAASQKIYTFHTLQNNKNRSERD